MLSHTNVTTNALNSLSELAIWSPSMRYLHVAPMFHLANGMGMSRGAAAGRESNVIVPGVRARGRS